MAEVEGLQSEKRSQASGNLSGEPVVGQGHFLEGGESVQEGREFAFEVVAVEDKLLELGESLEAPGDGSVDVLAADEFEQLEGWKEAESRGEGALKFEVLGTM